MSSEANIPPEEAPQADSDAVDQGFLDAMLAATPAQRLAWLEEALRLAYASGALKPRGFIREWNAAG
ncbi:MAG: hypothetical protein AB7G68_00985 [Nitrospiraceae bacterium]